MPDDPRLANLPALRKLAEEEARALVDASPVLYTALVSCTDDVRRMHAVAHLNLLSDLTRPASRDALARLVAERAGRRDLAFAPALRRRIWRPFISLGKHKSNEEGWALIDAHRDMVIAWFTSEVFHTEGTFLSVICSPTNQVAPFFWVPGVSAITDPAEALTLIALHVLGSPDADR